MRVRSLAWIVLAYTAGGAAALAAAGASGADHPVAVALVADLAAMAVVFAFSLFLDNSSVYDPYWSVAPLPIAAYWAHREGVLGEPRTWIVLGLLTAWGGRLTWNWVRRWRGLGEEDWRYVAIRERCGALYWPASFLGIHLLPTLLVFAGCLPLHAVLARGDAPVGIADLLAAAVAAAAIGIEAVADRQLWRFRSARRAGDGFLAAGLWARSRHPNYLGEVAFWWGVWLLGVAAAPASWWTAAGAISITLLFRLASVPMMDHRMRSRYPEYGRVMREVPAMIPRLF